MSSTRGEMGEERRKTAIVKSPGFLTVDLLWALFSGGENRSRAAESLFSTSLRLQPMDPTVEFLLEVLGFDPNADPLEKPGSQLPTKQLLTICQNGIQRLHELDVKKFKENQEILKIQVRNENLELIFESADFMLLHNQILDFTELMRRLKKANPVLFHPRQQFFSGPAFTAIYELLKRGIFRLEHSGEKIEKAILEACYTTIGEISTWGPFDPLRDETPIGTIFFGTLIDTCVNRFSDLSDDEVRESAFKEDNNLSCIANAVWQKSVKKLPGYYRIQKKKERLKEKGMSEEEIKEYIGEMLKKESDQFQIEYSDFLQERRKSIAVEYVTDKKGQREELKNVIIEYTKSLSTQAKPQRNVGYFLVQKIDSREIDNYLRETVFNLEAIKKDSGIPLRTINRFFKGLKSFHRQ